MQPDWIPQWLSLILEWIHQEQSLIAGMLALAGAYLTVRAVRRQINLQKKQWDDERDRRHLANRARLPLALSDIVDYTLSAYSICRHIFQTYSSATNASDSLAPPQLPSRALEVLATTVEYAIQEDLKLALVQLLSEIQVMHARLVASVYAYSPAGRHAGLNDRNAYAYRAYEAELLRARSERIFEYARNENERISPLRSKLDAEHTFCFGKPSGEFEQQVTEYIRTYWPESVGQTPQM